jgi:hypothetical protein
MSVFLQPLQTVTVGSGGAANVSFNNIPQGYTDLMLKISAAGVYSGGYDSLGMYFNGSQATISNTILNGNGSSANSSRSTYRALATLNGTNTPNVFTSLEIYIPNYTSANYKQIIFDGVTEANATFSVQTLGAELWSNTAAITSLSFDTATSGQNIAQYSKFSLYGVLRQGI